MKNFVTLLLLALLARVSLAAAPLEFRELRLLVQGRLPEAEIIADLKKRKLAKALDADEMTELKGIGAGPGLLAALARPDLMISAAAASSYEAEKARNAERAKLLSLPQVWILGQIMEMGERGDVFVLCNKLCITEVPQGQPKPDELVHFAAKPPSFRMEEKGPSFVNCMATITGLHEHTLKNGQMKTIQEVVMVEALTPTTILYGAGKAGPQTTATAKRPSVTKRATLPTGEWLVLEKYGGPKSQMKIHNIQMTFLKVQIEHTGPIQEIKMDSQGRTLIFDDGHGCKTYQVYDITCPSGSGVFEFEHTPDSASYPSS